MLVIVSLNYSMMNWNNKVFSSSPLSKTTGKLFTIFDDREDAL